MADQTLFTDDFKTAPYWWDVAPRPEIEAAAPPKRADAVVIGSGYTGLCASLQLARAGREVVVLDAESAGWGCSSRNGGLVSTGLKPGFDDLAPHHGAAARAIVTEAHNALAFIKDFVAEEELACDFDVGGKFFGAHTPAHFEKIAAAGDRQPEGLAVKAHVVPRAEQAREIDTEFYHGGVVFEEHASIDPAKYHSALLAKVRAAGVTIVPHCRAGAIRRDGDRFTVESEGGTVDAGQVLVATNGYTDAVAPWVRRRVILIGSYMIATEPLPAAVMDRIMPTARTIGDTRKVVYYYRPSPDRSRVIFGGRVTTNETNPRVSGPLLMRDLVALFPALAGKRISHSWNGFVAYTFDRLPHLGQNDGVYYAAGYCGSGVALATYFGTKVGQKMLGLAEGRTGWTLLSTQRCHFIMAGHGFLLVAYYRYEPLAPKRACLKNLITTSL